MQSVCTVCKEPKTVEELVKNRTYCKRCNAQWTLNWKRKNPQKAKEVQHNWWKRNRKAHRIHVREAAALKREKFKAWKLTQKCARCPENHPACLEFHHRDPKQKDMNISQMWRLGYSWERLTEEIAKCDVLCANCHRKLHFVEKGQSKRVRRKFDNPKSFRPSQLVKV